MSKSGADTGRGRLRGTVYCLLAGGLMLSAQQLTAATKTPSWIEIDPARLQRGTTARASWHLNNLTSYVYELDQRCYCITPERARVYVEKGQVTWIENLDNGRPSNAPEMLIQFKTIPQLFDQIDRILAGRPDAVSLEHDRYLGFPASFQANPQYLVADDEINYRIRWLKPLSPG